MKTKKKIIKYLFWKNNKKIKSFSCFLILFILLLGYSYYSYITYIKPASKRTDVNSNIDNTVVQDVVMQNLYTGKKISQTFKGDDKGIKSVSVCFERVNDYSKGNIIVSLLDNNNGNVIETWKTQISKLNNGKLTKFKLDKEIYADITNNRNYIIEIIGENIDDDSVFIVETTDDSYSNGEAFIDGVIQKGDIKFVIDPANVDNGFIKVFFIIIITFMFLGYFTIWLYVNNKKDFKIEWCFVIYMLFLGITYLVITPAFSVPDEQMHFASTYKLSNEMMGVEEEKEQTLVKCRRIDASVEHMNTMTSLDTYHYIYQSLFVKNENDEYAFFLGSPPQPNVFFITHLPQAIGIVISRVMNLNNVGLLFIGQLFTLLTYIFMVYYAIRIIPFGKQVLVAISGFPMVLHLATSFSYDAIIIGMASLVIAYILKLIYTEDKISIKECIILFILGIILAPCKMVYSIIIVLVFLIPNKKFFNKKFGVLYKIIVNTCVIGYAVLFNMGEVTNTSSGSHIVAWANEEGYTVSYLIHNFCKAIKIYVTTFHEKMNFYVDSMFGGCLGCFNIDIPVELTFCSLLLLIISLLEYNKYKLKSFQKVAFGVVFLIISVLICTTMLLAWTPISYDYIEGVQGRYFIPVLPLILLPFVNATHEQEKISKRFLFIGTYVLNFLVTLRVIEICVMR